MGRASCALSAVGRAPVSHLLLRACAVVLLTRFPLQVRTGLLMNLMGVLLLSLAMNTWAQTIFQLGTFPDWANTHSANVTALPPTLTNSTVQIL